MRASPAFRQQFFLHCTGTKLKESGILIDAMVLILLLTMPVWRVACVCIMCELFHGDELFLSFANFG